MYFCFQTMILLYIFVICIVLFVLFLFFVDCDITLFFYDIFSKKLETFKGKTIWITGASSGIGEYLAYQLAPYCCKLVLSGSNIENLRRVKSRCIEYGSEETNILLVPFDLRDFDEHEKAFQKIIDTFKVVDVFISNAGRSQRALFQNIDLRVDREIFDVNTFAPLNISRLLVRRWLDRNEPGHIVLVSSVAGIIGVPNSASYNASKHALHGYFEALRHEYSNKNIYVTFTYPGPVHSNILMNSYTEKYGIFVNEKHDTKSRRLNTKRCASLITVATANKLKEAWIAQNPLLLLLYLYQYLPSITKFLLPFFMLNLSSKVRDGREVLKKNNIN